MNHFFMILLQIYQENFFVPASTDTDKPNFVSFWYLLVQLLHTAKILSLETVAKREAILNPVPKQWVSKDIPCYGN